MKKKMFRTIISCFFILLLICLTACTAEFVLNTSVIPSDGGKITALSTTYEGDEVSIPSGSGAGTYKDSSEVTLSAEAALGFRFDHWSGDITGASSTTTLIMDMGKSVTAHFVAQYTLSTSVSPDEGGSVENPSGNIHDKGTRVTLTAIPASGYRFDCWSGDAESTSLSITLDMENNKILTAHFIPRYTLSTFVNPFGGGTVTPSGSDIYDEGTEVALTAKPASGYRFDCWSGDATSSSETTSISMNSDKRVTAHFITQYTISTSVKPSGGGIVNIPAGNKHDDGTEITITAVPASGYRFDHWGGDATGTSSTTTITMDENKVVIAYFAGTGPTKVIASTPDPIIPEAWGDDGCQWYYTITFTESNGVEATIERISLRYIDKERTIWWLKSGEWFDKTIVIPASGTNTYSNSVKSKNGGRPDFRSALLILSYKGHDANGNAFSGEVRATLAPKP